tara:strand:+ start:254 stop:451 length:198 start_codon:yes stop_codon:yes gene_type:complete
MSDEDGGEAFPVSNGVHTVFGMSLRDYFAGQALVGLVSPPGTGDLVKIYAADAYALADAMLEERK